MQQIYLRFGLKYLGPFMTLPLSLYIGLPSSPNLLILELCTSSKHLSKFIPNACPAP